MPVKIGIPTGFSGGLVREIENPAYSTAVGLVYHGMKFRDRAPAPAQAGRKDKSMTRMAQKMKEWFDQL
jgi:cell division ATPase FtsA